MQSEKIVSQRDTASKLSMKIINLLVLILCAVPDKYLRSVRLYVLFPRLDISSSCRLGTFTKNLFLPPLRIESILFDFFAYVRFISNLRRSRTVIIGEFYGETSEKFPKAIKWSQ